MAVTDSVTVIRAGKVIVRTNTASTSPEELAEAMVGSKISRAVTRADTSHGTPRLSVRNVSALSDHGHRALQNVSFDLFDGEILGVAGVAGNGQTELLEVLTGLRRVSDGSVSLSGEAINNKDVLTDPISLRRVGVGHVAEDRLKSGVVASMSARENAVLGYQREADFCRRGLMRLAAIDQAANDYFENQDVRPRTRTCQLRLFQAVTSKNW